MDKIHLLDESLINKIAAGEVIENPSSVVKELVENSIDAKASEIRIELKNGGSTLISVYDNGSGMGKNDALLSFARNATSKISKKEDLFCINTLGFRGEALSSIAAVSNVIIITNTTGSLTGTLLEVEAGKLLREEAIGAPAGTSIKVSGLFFNTPARKKYLSDPQTELGRVIDLVSRYALVNCDIAFNLIHDGKTVLFCPKSESLLARIASVYGKDTAKQMLEVSFKGVVSISGFTSVPSLTRSDRSQESVFVNGRYVKSDIVSEAAHAAYKTLLFHGRHPIYILMLQIDPREIDVNVHPAKKIIKFSDEKAAYDAVFGALTAALGSNDLIPESTLCHTQAKPLKAYPVPNDRQQMLSVAESPKRIAGQDSALGMQNSIGPLRIIGQLNKTYILAESAAGLAIIDQHAAEERILYEEFMEKYKNKGIEKQSLVRPIQIELSASESATLASNKGIFEELGFEIEEYGKNTFLVRSVPYIFNRFDSHLLHDLLSEIGSFSQKPAESGKEERIIRFSCRKAIKAGLELTNSQMESLLGRLRQAKVPFTCPHGRPTIINIQLAELERKFKRVF